jgi:hypothetical protein
MKHARNPDPGAKPLLPFCVCVARPRHAGCIPAHRPPPPPTHPPLPPPSTTTTTTLHPHGVPATGDGSASKPEAWPRSSPGRGAASTTLAVSPRRVEMTRLQEENRRLRARLHTLRPSRIRLSPDLFSVKTTGVTHRVSLTRWVRVRAVELRLCGSSVRTTPPTPRLWAPSSPPPYQPPTPAHTPSGKLAHPRPWSYRSCPAQHPMTWLRSW